MATLAICSQDDRTEENELRKPIISFGLITDIHYANHDDRWNYSQTFLRRYRNSFHLVAQACQVWLKKKYPVAFLIQLGDLIDGLCEMNQTSIQDLEIILQQFREFSSIYHLWGNHELYNFTRKQLFNGPLCSFPSKDRSSTSHYGIIEVCSNLKIIAIDTYDLSLLGIEKDSEDYLRALNVLRKYNPNEKTNDPTGLEGYNQRFIQLNGGLTLEQLHWLKEQLIKARSRDENVIIIGHIPIHPKVGEESALLWNYEDVLELLWSFDDIVLAYIAGHVHEGGYFYDEKTIHHLTLHAVVECEPETNAFATVHVYEQLLIIEGFGRIGNYQITMKRNFKE